MWLIRRDASNAGSARNQYHVLPVRAKLEQLVYWIDNRRPGFACVLDRNSVVRLEKASMSADERGGHHLAVLTLLSR